jgi:hypothetical protein
MTSVGRPRFLTAHQPAGGEMAATRAGLQSGERRRLVHIAISKLLILWSRSHPAVAP